jgi:hypothetical protein
VDIKKMILTFTVSQWTTQPDAMQKMADVVHGESMPVTWQLDFESARIEKELLDAYHRDFGDEICMILRDEGRDAWRKLFPWARLNCAGNPRPTHERWAELQRQGIEGLWGFCDQQIGPDGVTHWGCPWGLFYVSPITTFVPAVTDGTLVGTPWTLRDLHKCYHLKQAINFSTDPHEQIRSRTLDWGGNITFFQELFDELAANTPWNDRVYCCLHEEAHGPFVPAGCNESGEGASPEEGEAMYEVIRHWLRYAIARGATKTTLPHAVAEFRERAADGITIPSTLLTRDKFHGSIVHYVQPRPARVPNKSLAFAGHFPDTLFHFDNECQLVFVHPNIQPETVLDYRRPHRVSDNRPYPAEQVLPNICDWRMERTGDRRIYRYAVQSWYDLPYGLAEWGDFRGWHVESTSARWAKIIDDRVMLIRCNLHTQGRTPEEINAEAVAGHTIEVILHRNTSEVDSPNSIR